MNSALEGHAREIFSAAVRAAHPDEILSREEVRQTVLDAVDGAERVFVVGFGKAGASMARALEDILPRAPVAGAVIIPDRYLRRLGDQVRPRHGELLPGGHPHPDASSVQSARRLMDVARAASTGDVVIVLISGGGSALFADFPPEISLDDARRTNELLLASGASIHEVNSVRKHLSVVSGGRLAAAVHPARCLSLALSDVPGDDPAVIASGPTVSDASTFADALDVLDSRGIGRLVPASVRTYLEAGSQGEQAESIKPGDPRLDHSHWVRIGGNADALNGAVRAAERLGYRVAACEPRLEGEASDMGREIAREIVATDVQEDTCWIYGGETTVVLSKDAGAGGRSQELTLAAAPTLSRCPDECVLLAAGTDGIDGPTEAAGGIVSHLTADRALLLDVDVAAALRRHTSHDALKALGALVVTGPTHTNVMDVVVALRHPTPM